LALLNEFIIQHLFFYSIQTELKTTACPVVGVMHHMEIQHGKEGMKSAKFNDTMGETTCCTLGLLLNTLPPEQQGSKHRI
jgi:hypothetical protein